MRTRLPRARRRARPLALLPLLLILPIAARAQRTAPALSLIPMPRESAALPAMSLRAGASVTALSGSADDRFAARDLADALRARGIRVVPPGTAGAVRITLARTGTAAADRLLAREGLRFDSAMHDEGYVLVARGGRVDVVGATAAGVFYGAQTVEQLVSGHGRTAALQGARIRDWPAMRWRGLHDDLSRGPVPTLDFQKEQIRIFAAHKLNVYSPYFEHTLEYPSNPLIAPPGGAMTPAQVKELVAFARPYHVTIVPEQEAFGHLHHILKYELYSSLAETPHGHVLAPGDNGSLPLIRAMFTNIDTLFPGPFMHLGADETFELGRGQTAQRVDSLGIGPVYIDFLKEIESTLRPMGKRLLFWGDIAMNSPDLVKTLPHDMIAVPWSYGPRASFDRLITPFRDAAMETWVAPGVNNWSRVFPDNAMSLPNIQGFARDGQRLGAVGMLNTSWDDDGESLFNQTWYGVLFGAAAGWQPGESDTTAFENSYGRVFQGDTSGALDAAQRKLSAAHALLQQAKVGDASDQLFWIDPYTPEGQTLAERIRPVTHQLRILAESAIVLADEASRQPLLHPDAVEALKLGARRMDFIGMKFQMADEIVQMYQRATAAVADSDPHTSPLHDLGDITGINGRMQDLRDGYGLIRDLYQAAWLRENRPYWLDNVLARYDAAIQLWIERGDRVNLARQQYYRYHTLPSAADVGLPASMPGLEPGTTAAARP